MEPRLLSLELVGYKTFASRTLFEFPGMITAVVGPNGSGKSNIADALRWVLGEQSYSLLRGKKTEDMIFAGSEQRTRAGMASVTITFDNSDGWLPIDFTEVSISRRAYRDGQNEYLLNHQRVRLKEISELLSKSGLAERTYTVIGQGLVDAALALKPEERRRLFEEAAGIGLYRSRKEEALNRLEATRRNLERVQDILAEIEPRLQSLEKQARRAQEYERVKADLRLLLQDWYGYHWHKNQVEYNHVRDILKAQEERLEAARQKHNEVTQAMNDLRAKMQSWRDKLNEWHSGASRLHTELTQMSQQLAVLDERQRSLGEQQASAQQELARSEEEQSAFQSNLGLAQEELSRVEKELEEARIQALQSRKNLAARQVERDQVERSLRNARQELTAAETRQVQLRAHQHEIAQRQETIARNQESVEKTLASLRQEAVGLESSLHQWALERDGVERARQEKENQWQSLRQQISEQESERRRVQDQKSRIDANKARIRAQVEVLEQAERSLSGYSEGARSLIQAARQKKLQGDYQLLSSFLEVPQGYEIAFTAILGELIDLVLLDQAADVEQALALIEQDARGRVALIKPGTVPAAEQAALPEEEDILGWAADLATPKDENVAPLLARLLGQTLVVKDRQAAYRLLPRLPQAAAVVTLKGEVFAPHGPIWAGKVGRTGMISRARQIREFNDALAQEDRQLDQNHQALQAVEGVIAALAQQDTDLARQVREMAAHFEKARDTLQKGQNSLEQVQRQIGWYEGQQKELDGQQVRVKNELDKDSADLSRLDATISSSRDEVKKWQHALGDLSLDEYQSQVTHWDTAMAVSNRAVKEVQARVEERRQRVSENQARQLALRERLEAVGKSMAALHEQRARLQEQETTLNREIQSFQALITPAEEELDGLERQMADQQEVEGASLQALTLAERHTTQADLDLTRNRDALQALQRKIEDDFGLVEFEYVANVAGQSPLPFDGMVKQLPVVVELSPEIEDNITRFKTQLRRMGSINPDALSEFQSVQERYHSLVNQVADLNKAEADLRQVIVELDELMKRDFRKTFNAVAAEFHQMFTRLFGGGSAHLVMLDEENPIDTGIDIEARLPGRRPQGLSLLSGGERSLTAAALVFSLLKVSPTPFCVMDEVDAMLDESNVGRFCDMLRELSQTTQFIVITHNRNTVQAANVIYGITMGRDSTSQMISVKLDEIDEDMIV